MLELHFQKSSVSSRLTNFNLIDLSSMTFVWLHLPWWVASWVVHTSVRESLCSTAGELLPHHLSKKKTSSKNITDAIVLSSEATKSQSQSCRQQNERTAKPKRVSCKERWQKLMQWSTQDKALMKSKSSLAKHPSKTWSRLDVLNCSGSPCNGGKVQELQKIQFLKRKFSY